jgi:hypothetical protein
VVAVEEGRVDFHARYLAAGHPEPDHHPVEGRRVVPPRLPAVVPGAAVYEDAWARDRRRLGGEVGG